MRYRVYYQQDGSCTNEDFCICWANSETEAAEVFRKYHPDDVIDHIELQEEDTSLRALAVGADEHEFLVSLLEVIEDEGLEAQVYRKLRESWCPTQPE